MRAHVMQSDIPVAEGQDLTANCNEIVPKAKFVFWFDASTACVRSINSFVMCRECGTSFLSKRYIYGILHGEEAKQSEGAA